MWLTCVIYVLPSASNLERWVRSSVLKIVRRPYRLFYWLCFCCLCTVLHCIQGCLFFLPFCWLTMFQAWFIWVLQLRKLANSPSLPSCSFWPNFWILLWLLSPWWSVAWAWFSWAPYRIVLFCFLVFVIDYSTRAWGSAFLLFLSLV